MIFKKKSTILKINDTSFMNLPSIFIDGKFEQNSYVNAGRDEDNQFFPQYIIYIRLQVSTKIENSVLFDVVA